jgi:two-component system, OmpR family, response regulator ArlR
MVDSALKKPAEKISKKILIVEDEAALLKVLNDKLVHEGFIVLEASNGEEGLKLALTEHPDLILLDVIMPKVGGLKMLQALRDDAWGKRVHVFILTNVDKSKEITEGMNYNVAKYFIKSDIKLEDLVWSMKLYLRGGS